MHWPFAKFSYKQNRCQVEKAFEAGDLDLVSELETQIWFDGTGRTPEQVNQPMRKLLYEMNRIALAHEVKQLGNDCRTQSPLHLIA